MFIGLTEVVTGITLSKATGGVQIALTVFVILFPLFIASVFFIILWKRPYVFYPPTEFDSVTNVDKYVSAMKNIDSRVETELEIEVENLRSEINLQFSAQSKRFVKVEEILGKYSDSIADSAKYYTDFKKAINEISEREKVHRIEFNRNSEIRVKLTTVTATEPTNEEYDNIVKLSSALKELGYKTYTSGTASGNFELNTTSEEYKKIRIFPAINRSDIAEKIKNEIIELTNINIEVMQSVYKPPHNEYPLNEFDKFGLWEHEDLNFKQTDIVIAYFLS